MTKNNNINTFAEVKNDAIPTQNLTQK